ncbi:hypothetical protein GCM10028806_58270 [Spirosoma terrae]
MTPTLPGLIGKQSFRLLPEGVTFAKPVTLQFHYQQDELEGTSDQLLFMAYQGNDGIWKALPNTELDEATRTLTVNTTHFSDWGAFAEFNLEVEKTLIKPGESTNLKLVGYYDDLHKAPDAERSEVALTQQQVLQDPGKVRNWRVAGVEVHDFIPPKFQPRKGATGKAIILANIAIEGNSFEATWAGKTYACNAIGFISQQGVTIVTNVGNPNSQNRVMTMSIRANQLKASTTYSYDNLKAPLDGRADIMLSDGLTAYWATYVYPCNGGQINSPNSIRIDSVDGKTITGSLTATLYLSEDCKISSQPFTARFRLTLIAQ